jgi:hypothetical protein
MEHWEESINWGIVDQVELLYPGIKKVLKVLKVGKVINPSKFYASKGTEIANSIFETDSNENYTVNDAEFNEAIFVRDGTISTPWIVRAGNIYAKLAWGIGPSY